MYDRRHPHLRGGIFARQRHGDLVEHVGGAISRARDNAAIGPAEIDALAAVVVDRETAFVHERVMIRAEQREIVETRLATVRPMLDVMPVDVTVIPAARKRAAAIPGPERTSQRRRYRAVLAADIERRAVLVLDDRDQTTVAGEALDGLDRQIRSPNPSAEGFFVDVQDDLVVIGDRNGSSLARPRFASQMSLRDRDERIGLLCAPRICRTLRIRAELGAERRIARGDRALDRPADELAVLDRQLYVMRMQPRD